MFTLITFFTFLRSSSSLKILRVREQLIIKTHKQKQNIIKIETAKYIGVLFSARYRKKKHLKQRIIYSFNQSKQHANLQKRL